jgi:hypothetical protein
MRTHLHEEQFNPNTSTYEESKHIHSDPMYARLMKDRPRHLGQLSLNQDDVVFSALVAPTMFLKLGSWHHVETIVERARGSPPGTRG